MDINKPIIDVIIPALNEELSIAKVIRDIPKSIIRHIIVVDNGSTDFTKKNAEEAGAIVLKEDTKGYGIACQTGVNYLKQLTQQPDIVVFIDGDYSDYPEEIPELVLPIIEKEMDLVIGSRTLGKREKHSLTLPQIFGNWLATKLIYLFYKAKYTDLGPFRAIKLEVLEKINMQDMTYGWTVEMQLKVAKNHMNFCEIPVNYRNRIGTSKISGTVKGSILAGYKIIVTIFKYL